jgi:hypothetical protein
LEEKGGVLPAALAVDIGRITRVADAIATAFTPAEFQRRFERASEPALLNGLMRDWPALPQPRLENFGNGGEGGSSSIDRAARDAGRAGCSAPQDAHRAWTPENLVRRFGEHLFECGADEAGGDVHVALRSYVEHYAPQCRDRNPFVIFDAVAIDMLSQRQQPQQPATPSPGTGQVAEKEEKGVAAAGFARQRSGNNILQPLLFLDIDGVLNRTASATHVRVDADLVARLGACRARVFVRVA